MFAFAQLETALATHLRVAEQHRARFSIRLKHFQRMGWPRGVNNGRKYRVSYTAQQVLEVAFVLELVELGLSPDRAIGLVEFWWDDLRRSFLLARDAPFPIVFAFLRGDAAGLQSDEDRAEHLDDRAAIIGIDPGDSADQLRAALTWLASGRASVINVSDVLSGLTEGIEAAYAESALIWAQTEPWRLELADPDGNIRVRKRQ